MRRYSHQIRSPAPLIFAVHHARNGGQEKDLAHPTILQSLIFRGVRPQCSYPQSKQELIIDLEFNKCDNIFYRAEDFGLSFSEIEISKIILLPDLMELVAQWLEHVNTVFKTLA